MDKRIKKVKENLNLLFPKGNVEIVKEISGKENNTGKVLIKAVFIYNNQKFFFYVLDSHKELKDYRFYYKNNETKLFIELLKEDYRKIYYSTLDTKSEFEKKIEKVILSYQTKEQILKDQFVNKFNNFLEEKYKTKLDIKVDLKDAETREYSFAINDNICFSLKVPNEKNSSKKISSVDNLSKQMNEGYSFSSRNKSNKIKIKYKDCPKVTISCFEETKEKSGMRLENSPLKLLDSSNYFAEMTCEPDSLSRLLRSSMEKKTGKEFKRTLQIGDTIENGTKVEFNLKFNEDKFYKLIQDFFHKMHNEGKLEDKLYENPEYLEYNQIEISELVSLVNKDFAFFNKIDFRHIDSKDLIDLESLSLKIKHNKPIVLELENKKKDLDDKIIELRKDEKVKHNMLLIEENLKKIEAIVFNYKREYNNQLLTYLNVSQKMIGEELISSNISILESKK